MGWWKDLVHRTLPLRHLSSQSELNVVVLVNEFLSKKMSNIIKDSVQEKESMLQFLMIFVLF